MSKNSKYFTHDSIVILIKILILNERKKDLINIATHENFVLYHKIEVIFQNEKLDEASQIFKDVSEILEILDNEILFHTYESSYLKLCNHLFEFFLSFSVETCTKPKKSKVDVLSK